MSDSYTWEPTSAPSQAWQTICSSSSGQYLAAIYFINELGYIYTSSDFGGTWVQKSVPNNPLSSICISSSGDLLAACVENGYIYTSIDFGEIWVKTSAPYAPWISICISSTGQYLAACVYGGGYIYTSSDYGGTWVKTSAPSNNWSSICISSSGQYLAACVLSGNIYTSSDYGGTWVQTSTQPMPAIKICSSSSGQYLATYIYSSYNSHTIYTSNNYGATWVQTSVTYENLISICSSSSGQYLAATGNNIFNGGNGYIYTSSDYGETWVLSSVPTSIPYNGISINSNGSQLVAIADVGGIYIGRAPIPPIPPVPPIPPIPPVPPIPPIPPIPAPSDIVITTNPNPVIAGQPTIITYKNGNYLPILNNSYVLKNQLGVTVSDVYIGSQEIKFTFRNVYLIAGLNVLYIYNLDTSLMGPIFYVEVSSICFKEGTKILCKNGYIPIEQLNELVYVKTNKHGYKKVKYLIKTRMINSSKRTINKLYVMRKSEKNGLIEDLYVTGSHALLKDKLSEKEEKQMDKLLSIFKDVKYERMLDDKHKILACFDKRFEEHNEEGYYNIYHIVLEDDNIYYNYGIYANGILTESTMENTLSKLNNYDLIM